VLHETAIHSLDQNGQQMNKVRVHVHCTYVCICMHASIKALRCCL